MVFKLKLWWKTKILKQDIRSEWMKGLLWAENFIGEGMFFEDDKTGVESLKWELYHSGEFTQEDSFNNEWFKGAEDYLKHYERRKEQCAN